MAQRTYPYAVWFGEQIRQARVLKDWSLESLGRRTGDSTSYLSDIENGKTMLSVDVLARIAHAMNMDWLALLHARIHEEQAKEGPLAAPPTPRLPRVVRTARRRQRALQQTREQLAQARQRHAADQQQAALLLAEARHLHATFTHTLGTTSQLCANRA